MPHSFWWLVVDAGCVFRLTALLTRDTITQPVRSWLGRPFELGGAKLQGGRWWLFELATCPWCISVWIAAATVTFTVLAPAVWQYVAFAACLSAAAGVLSERV